MRAVEEPAASEKSATAAVPRFVERGALHRDLALALFAAFASISACAIPVALARSELPSGSTAAYAFGYALGAAAAWGTASAVARSASVILGVVVLALLFPVAGLGGEYLAAWRASGSVARSTVAVIEGPKAASAIDHLLRGLSGLVVLGPLLVARRVQAGLAWELAAPLGGVLLGALALGLAFVHMRAGPDLGMVVLAPVAVQALLGSTAFVLGLRIGEDGALAWWDRHQPPGEPHPGSRRGGLAALGVVLALGGYLGSRGPTADVVALDHLPWPRTGCAALSRTAHELDPDLQGDLRATLHPRAIPSWSDPALLAATRLPRLGAFAVASCSEDDLLARASRIDALIEQAARRGDVEAMTLRGAQLLRFAASANFRGVPFTPSRDGALAWLRRAAALGSTTAALRLHRTLSRSGPENVEALDRLLEAARRNPEVYLHAAQRVRAVGTPEPVARQVLAGLRALASGPPGEHEYGGYFQRCIVRDEAWANLALRELARTAPEAELGWLIPLAAAHGEGRALQYAHERRLSAGTFTLADAVWACRWQWPDYPVPQRPDALALWPRQRAADEATAAAVDLAGAALRAGRPVDAWRELDRVPEPRPRSPSPVTLARAIVYLEFVALREPVRGPHILDALALACPQAQRVFWAMGWEWTALGVLEAQGGDGRILGAGLRNWRRAAYVAAPRR